MKRDDFWRTLEERADQPSFRRFLADRFPALTPLVDEARSRRRFLQLMGASFAMAGMVGCRRSTERIEPYASRPEGRDPGAVVRYATTWQHAGVGLGLLVTTVDGRPIKVEGNPDHPASLGGTSAAAQAAILQLYDPDRSRNVLDRQRGEDLARDRAAFEAFAEPHFEALRASGGRGLVVLSEANSSPSLQALRRRLAAAAPEARWLQYEAWSRDNERAGSKMVLADPYRSVLHLDQAEVIVSLDADLLGDHPDATRHARDWAVRRRAADGSMSRLFVAESQLTLTGAQADERLPMQSWGVASLALHLATELNNLYPYGPYLSQHTQPLHRPEARSPADAEQVRKIAAELLEHQGRSLVVAGPRQPAEVHAVCHMINAGLHNVGRAVVLVEDPEADRSNHDEAIADLTSAMGRGAVETLLMIGGNPVHDAPVDLDFAGKLSGVGTSIHLSLYDNETSRACSWHVPRAHTFEAWGDARSWDGTYSVAQPLIEPLYGGVSELELMALVAGDSLTDGNAIIQRTVNELFAPVDLDTFWRRALHDGLVAGSAWPKQYIAWSAADLGARVQAFDPGARAGALEVVFAPDTKVYDGRYANSGWLQELPDALTKITWDNAALIAPRTAEELGVTTNDVLELTLDGRSVELPAYVMPGQAAGSICLPLGYGRVAAGEVGDGVGTDVYPLRTSVVRFNAPGLKVQRTGKVHDLACTQDHFPLDDIGEAGIARRLGELYREADLEIYREQPDFAHHVLHHPPLQSMWREHDYPGNRWAMVVDLSVCIGCNTCVVACQAENNIPVVGREQIERGREMHWIRIDRYFGGDPDTPRVALQPVACHHCELAPCEQVCPVAATVHDSEGLNVMVYNRCVGTRYCSNNCPYKVRRFNFLKYRDEYSDIEKMAFNPQVTVRSRGVMEKCSFCVQRINAVKIAARNDGRRIEDGEIVPACAQACPSGAIVFGDANDPDSKVAALVDHDRTYGMLEELNNKPRLRYMAKLRNPLWSVEHHADHAGQEAEPTTHHDDPDGHGGGEHG